MPDLQARLQAAVDLHQQGDLPAAQRIYTEVLQADPGNTDALHLMGVSLRGSDPLRATLLIAEAITLNPAGLASATNNLRNAVGSLVDAAAKTPAKTQVLLQPVIDPLARVLAALGDVALADVLVRTLGLKGFPGAGLALLERSGLDGDGGAGMVPDLAVAKGLLLERMGRTAEACAVLSACADGAPDLLPCWQMLARVAFTEGRRDLSRKAYEQCVRLDPNDEWSHFNLNLFLRNARHRDAEDMRAEYRLWRDKAVTSRPARRAIVSSSDANYFPLAKGLILSLEARGVRADYSLYFIDAGCTAEQLAWLSAHTDGVSKPTKEIPFPDGYPDYVRTHIARSFIPDIFPGHDHYLWLDSDMWVQDRSAVDMYFHEAGQGRIAATCDVDRTYYNRYWMDKTFLNEVDEAYKLGWTDAHAEKYRTKACFNSGSFCAAAGDPFWNAYEAAIIEGLHTAATKDSFSHIIENAAFNETLYTLGRVAILPSFCNWQCGLATPFLDDDGVARQPFVPYEPVGIVHLTVQKMRRDYVRLGLLYDQGRYLAPEEIKGFL